MIVLGMMISIRKQLASPINGLMIIESLIMRKGRRSIQNMNSVSVYFYLKIIRI